MIEGETGNRVHSLAFDYDQLRSRFPGAYMANNEYDESRATEALTSGHADLVCMGRPFISNPDLVERLLRGTPLNALIPGTLYGGDAHGYTDYPSLNN